VDKGQGGGGNGLYIYQGVGSIQLGIFKLFIYPFCPILLRSGRKVQFKNQDPRRPQSPV